MRIRWKLFWLLAALSLVPLVVLRVNSQLALSRLAERLSSRVGTHLVAEAKTRLGRTVEDHARLLAGRRQTLSLAVALQADAVGLALAAPPDKAHGRPKEAVITTALPAMPMGMGIGRADHPDHEGFTDTPGYFRLDLEGRPLPLPIAPGRVLLRLPPEAHPEALPPDAAALAGLVRPLKRIAAVDDAAYATGHVADLAPGTIILIGSDGLWEARNADDEMFGKRRTRDVLAQAAPGGPQAVCQALMDALDAFRGETRLADDVTLLAVALTAKTST